MVGQIVKTHLMLLQRCLKSNNKKVYFAAIESIKQSSEQFGPALNPHLRVILPLVAKRQDLASDERIRSLSECLVKYGGREAEKMLTLYPLKAWLKSFIKPSHIIFKVELNRLLPRLCRHNHQSAMIATIVGAAHRSVGLIVVRRTYSRALCVWDTCACYRGAFCYCGLHWSSMVHLNALSLLTMKGQNLSTDFCQHFPGSFVLFDRYLLPRWNLVGLQVQSHCKHLSSLSSFRFNFVFSFTRSSLSCLWSLCQIDIF